MCVGSWILDLGSFVLAYVHTYMHTYMHLGSWIFCVGSYLYSSIGSSNVPFVRSHFGLSRVCPVSVLVFSIFYNGAGAHTGRTKIVDRHAPG